MVSSCVRGENSRAITCENVQDVAVMAGVRVQMRPSHENVPRHHRASRIEWPHLLIVAGIFPAQRTGRTPAGCQHYAVTVQMQWMARTGNPQPHVQTIVNFHLLNGKSAIKLYADLVKVTFQAMIDAQAGNGWRQSGNLAYHATKLDLEFSNLLRG